VGGLGDVVAGLGKACIERGHNVSVIMPFYESLDNDQVRVRCFISHDVSVLPCVCARVCVLAEVAVAAS